MILLIFVILVVEMGEVVSVPFHEQAKVDDIVLGQRFDCGRKGDECEFAILPDDGAQVMVGLVFHSVRIGIASDAKVVAMRLECAADDGSAFADGFGREDEVLIFEGKFVPSSGVVEMGSGELVAGGGRSDDNAGLGGGISSY